MLGQDEHGTLVDHPSACPYQVFYPWVSMGLYWVCKISRLVVARYVDMLCRCACTYLTGRRVVTNLGCPHRVSSNES